MKRRKHKQKAVKVPPVMPTQGIWIKAHMDENGGVTWTCNYPNAQRFSNLYAAVKEWCHGLNIKTTKKGLTRHTPNPAHWTTTDVKTREFKGAMAAALKVFNSRSHRRRFGVWFEIHTAPLDRAYIAWKLTQGGQ